jgi:hypothetical protein
LDGSVRQIAARVTRVVVVRVPVVALLHRRLHDAVAAALAQATIRRALIVAAVIRPVVALFSEQTIDDPVAAERARHAAGRASPVRAHIDAVIALLEGHLRDVVATVGAEFACHRAVAVGPIIDAIVALLIGCLDSVAANARAHAQRAMEIAERQSVVGLRCMSLGLKHDDFVDRSERETKSRRGRGVQHEASGERAVHTAEIDDALLVDEDPNIVVARQVQLLAAGVLKPVTDLAREVEVLRVSRWEPAQAQRAS